MRREVQRQISMDKDMSSFVASHIFYAINGYNGSFGPCEMYEDKHVHLVWHNYQRRYGTIELSVLADNPRWLTRDLLKKIVHYVEECVKCHTVILRCERDNDVVVRIGHVFNAETHVLTNCRGLNRDEVVMVISVDNFKRSRFWRN